MRTVRVFASFAAGVTVLSGVVSASSADGQPLKVQAPPGRASSRSYEPILVPDATAGRYGWSVSLPVVGGRRATGFIVAASGVSLWRVALSVRLKGPPYRARGLLIAADGVAAVTVDGGPPIPTSQASGLPFGLRMVAYEIPTTSGEGARRILFHSLPIDVTALDGAGNPIAPFIGPEPGGGPLETTSWSDSEAAKPGVCSISGQGLPGLTALGGSVVSTLRPVTGLDGRPFLSCTQVTYQLGGRVVEAALLLDAAHPGTVEPAPIPGAGPVPHHPGVVQVHLPSSGLVARRTRHGWLMLEGAGTLREGLIVLAHLHAAGPG